MTCKNCQEAFHYCGGCETNVYRDIGYCSKTCFEKSIEYQTIQGLIKRFFESLSQDQKIMFESLWDNGILEEPAFEPMVDDFAYFNRVYAKEYLSALEKFEKALDGIGFEYG